MSRKQKNAVSLMYSWLRNSGVSFKMVQGCDHHFEIQSKSGNKNIRIGFGKDDCYQVDPEALMTNKRQIGVKEYKKMCESLDIPFVSPFRGSETDLVSCSRGTDGVAERIDYRFMRHMDFRNCADPDPKELREYEGVMKTTLSKLWFSTSFRMQRLGYEKEDIFQYGYVWLCIFLNKYIDRDMDHKANCKLLVSYLKQRFFEASKLIQRSEKSQTPNMEDVESYLYSDLKMIAKADTDGDTVQMNYEYYSTPNDDVVEIEKPVLPASQSLRSRFNKLPVQERIEMLRDASMDESLDDESRNLAASLVSKALAST